MHVFVVNHREKVQNPRPTRRLAVVRWLSLAVCLGVLGAGASGAQAADVRVAVAANFSAPMQTIARAFEQATGHKAILSWGSTGNLFAQIQNGAPFDVLLAADDETPRKLEHLQWAVAGSRFTYALGRLVLWSRQPGLVDDQAEVLRAGRFHKIAIANPKLAPYGAAAMEVLSTLGLTQTLQPKFVQGDNIAQTYQFVATENATLGFVALSQVVAQGRIVAGSAWLVPAHLHTPIRQAAVLLHKGRDNPAAHALLSYLRSDTAKSIIRAHGYEL